MISPALIYFIGILDSVSQLFFVIIAISAMIAVAFFMWLATDADMGRMTHEMQRRCFILSLSSFVIFSILFTFTPSSKLAAAMFIVPAVANNENVQAIGSNSLEALRKLTEQWLRELDGSKPQVKEDKI